MPAKTSLQPGLFDDLPPICEYYPVLLPSEETMEEIARLNQVMADTCGLRSSQFIKLPHISINGKICPEDDEKVINDIASFLSTQAPLPVEFSAIDFFPGKRGLTVKLGVSNPELILEFDRTFMKAIGGKPARLNLHLTLARYVHPDVFRSIQASGIIYPSSCTCRQVAVLKRKSGEKGAYSNIAIVPFG